MNIMNVRTLLHNSLMTVEQAVTALGLNVDSDQMEDEIAFHLQRCETCNRWKAKTDMIENEDITICKKCNSL